MNQLTEEDTERIAAVVRLAGDLLDAHGPLALELTKAWKRGLRSPNIDPDAGGWRYETIENPDGTTDVVPIPSDSTGEGAIRADDLDGAYDELQKILHRLSSDAARLRDIISAAVPPGVALSIVDPGEWCTNHLTIQQCEPRHRGDLCRFCYDFHAVRKRLPPASILGLRHRYGRVTEKQVAAALSRESRRDESLQRVNDAVKRGRNKRAVAPEPVTPPPEPTEEERKAAIEDRRRKRLAS